MARFRLVLQRGTAFAGLIAREFSKIPYYNAEGERLARESRRRGDMHSAFHAERTIQERQREAFAVAQWARLTREAQQDNGSVERVRGFVLRLTQSLNRRRPRLEPAPSDQG